MCYKLNLRIVTDDDGEQWNLLTYMNNRSLQSSSFFYKSGQPYLAQNLQLQWIGKVKWYVMNVWAASKISEWSVSSHLELGSTICEWRCFSGRKNEQVSIEVTRLFWS